MYANIRARDLKSQDLRRPRKTQGASLPVPSEPLSAALQFLKAILDGHKVLLQFNPAKLPLRNRSHTFSRLFQFHSKFLQPLPSNSFLFGIFHRFDSIFVILLMHFKSHFSLKFTFWTPRAALWPWAPHLFRIFASHGMGLQWLVPRSPLHQGNELRDCHHLENWKITVCQSLQFVSLSKRMELPFLGNAPGELAILCQIASWSSFFVSSLPKWHPVSRYVSTRSNSKC